MRMAIYHYNCHLPNMECEMITCTYKIIFGNVFKASVIKQGSFLCFTLS